MNWRSTGNVHINLFSQREKRCLYGFVRRNYRLTELLVDRQLLDSYWMLFRT